MAKVGSTPTLVATTPVQGEHSPRCLTLMGRKLGKSTCFCPTQPTSDWAEEFDSRWTVEHLGFLDNSSIKTFIRQIEAQAEEKGRREEREEWKEAYKGARRDGELATITLFEEFADDMELTDRKKKLPKKHDIMIAGMEELVKKAYNLALTDLLAFAENMKTNTTSHD